MSNSERHSETIDQIASRFEEAWRRGDPLSIESCLAKITQPLRGSLLSELIRVELELCLQAGTQLDAQAYRDRFPNDFEIVERAIRSFEISTHNRIPTDETNARPDTTSLTSDDRSSLENTIRTGGVSSPDDTDPRNQTELTLGQQGSTEKTKAQLKSKPLGAEAKTPLDQTAVLSAETQAYPQSSSGIFRRQVNDYEILEEIARGGMGVVYKARQLKLNRIVALKMILSGELAGDEEVRRFRLEAESAAKLDHQGIVPIFEVGQSGGNYFFSMGFVDGESLKQKLSEKPLAEREAVQLLRSVADAVAYAHEMGVIHRDLKPANVLVDRSGVPRITDFGLAKQLHVDADFTTTGQILGTPAYMPPEQASGNSGAVGPTADVYSLGAILYEMLTGNPPFRAVSSLDLLIMVREKEPISPRAVNPKISKDLETICLKCLDKAPQRRYSTVTELVADIDRFLGGHAIEARPISLAHRAWRMCKRRPVQSALAGLSLALLLTLSIGGPALAIHNSRLAQRNFELAQSEAGLRTEAEKQAIEEQRLRMVAQQATAAAESRLNLAMSSVERLGNVLRQEEFSSDPGLTEVRKNLSLLLVELYRSLREDLQRDNRGPVKTQLAAQIAGNLAFNLLSLDQTDEAKSTLEESKQLLESELSLTPDDHLADELVDQRLIYGSSFDDFAAFEEVEKLINVHDDKTDRPEVWRQNRIALHEGLGAYHVRHEQYELAIAQFAKAQKLHEAGEGEDATKNWNLAMTAAGAFGELGDVEEADRMIDMAIKSLAQQNQDSPSQTSRRVLAKAYSNKAGILRARDPEKARQAMQKAIELTEELADEFPGLTKYHELQIDNLRKMRQLMLFSRLEQAETQPSDAFDFENLLLRHLIQLALLEPSDYQNALVKEAWNTSSVRIGLVQNAKNEPSAVSFAQQLCRIWEALHYLDPSEPDWLLGLGGWYCNCGLALSDKWPAAGVPWFSRSIAVLEPTGELSGDDNIMRQQFLRNALSGRASALAAIESNLEAAEDWTRVIELDRQLVAPVNQKLAHQVELNRARARSGSHLEAHQLLVKLPGQIEPPLTAELFYSFVLAAADIKELFAEDDLDDSEEATEKVQQLTLSVAEMLEMALASGVFRRKEDLASLLDDEAFQAFASDEEIAAILRAVLGGPDSQDQSN